MDQSQNEERAVLPGPRADDATINYRQLAEELVAQHSSPEFLRDARAMDRNVAGEQFVLKFLFDHDGSSHPTDMRRGMGVTSSRVAAILRCLERRGFVERTVDPTDRRRAIVTLTDAGRACVTEHRAAAVERFVWLLERLGPEDARAFVHLHRRMHAIFREAHGANGEDAGRASAECGGEDAAAGTSPAPGARVSASPESAAGPGREIECDGRASVSHA